MADVSGDDRAQLILVGGIVVAFALVALVLLLNTALFAENIATRGLGPAPDRASDHAVAAEHAADRILRHEEHERLEYVKWAHARDNATRNIFRVDEVVRVRQFQDHGAFATVESISLRRGAALVQTNQSRNFTAGGANVSRDDWVLANTDGIRNFTMTVDAANTSNRSASGNFTVLIRGNNGRWSAEVYENETANATEVHTDGTTCRSNTPVATINWTDGNLDGCSFPFAVNSTDDALEPPYNVTFENGSNASGTYHLVVSNRTFNDDVRKDNFGAPNTTANPRLYHAVYSACLTVHYDEATVDYETHVRAAPGEPEQTMPSPPSC